MAVRIGGQAVIEGVMMKNMDRYAVSVRKPNGKIETKVEECVSFAEKHPLFQLPVFRGMANFLESMVIGMKTLNYSASFYEDEEEQTESRTEQLLEKILGEKAEKIIMGIVLVFSLAISIGLFMILPYIASEALGKLIRNEYVILFMEGIIRIAIFLGSASNTSAILFSIFSFGVRFPVSYCAILGPALSSPIPTAIPSSFCVIPLMFRILLMFSPVLIFYFAPFVLKHSLEM